MKTASLTALTLLLLTTSVIGQVKTEASDPPYVSVLEKSWSQKTHYQDGDPNTQNLNRRTPNEDAMKEARREKSVFTNIKDGPTTERATVQSTLPIMKRHTYYVYKIKAKNDGQKTIKTLYWEYQFLDPDTGRVLGAHPMMSSKKLSPGKTGVFKAETVLLPVTSVSADQFDKKFQLKFTERVIIYGVDYTDGSVWRRP